MANFVASLSAELGETNETFSANLKNSKEGSMSASFGESSIATTFYFGEGLVYNPSTKIVSVDFTDKVDPENENSKVMRPSTIPNTFKKIPLSTIAQYFDTWKH